MDVIDQLRELREFGGKPRTTGLDDASIERMAANDPLLVQAIDRGRGASSRTARRHGRFPQARRERADATSAQAGFVNFYPG